MLYVVTFTINRPPMLAYYMPYMDPMGYDCNYPRPFLFCHALVKWFSCALHDSMAFWSLKGWTSSRTRSRQVPPEPLGYIISWCPFPGEWKKQVVLHPHSWNILEPFGTSTNSWMFGQPSYNLVAHEIPPAIYRNMPHAYVQTGKPCI